MKTVLMKTIKEFKMRQQKFLGGPKLKVQSRGSGEKTGRAGHDWMGW